MKIAVLGTRRPVTTQLYLAAVVAKEFSGKGFDIFTGGSRGVDQSVMMNCKEPKLNVVIPWLSYAQDMLPSHANIYLYDEFRDPAWRDAVFAFHPNPSVLSKGAIAIHACTYGAVVGSELLVAFPQSGGNGATAIAIKMATYYDIPVIPIEPESAISKGELMALCIERLREQSQRREYEWNSVQSNSKSIVHGDNEEW